MKNVRYRFLFALIILIVSVLVGLGLLIGQLFKTYYINSFHNQFAKEGNLIVEQIEKQGGIASLDEKQIETVNKITGAQITVIDENGTPIYETGTVMEQYNKHNEVIKKIVEQAIDSQSGLIHIGSGYDLSYYWKSITVDNQMDGILILTTELEELNRAYKQIWLSLFICLGIAFIVILYIGTRIITSFTKPVESATNTAIELAKGNYQARTYEDSNNELSMLNKSINILARNLQRITKEQEMQTNRLTTLIENMGIPLIVIDDKGYINLTNHTYKEVFRRGKEELVGQSYIDGIEHEEIKQIIEYVFMTEQKVRKQLIIPIHIQLKHLEVYGAPIISLTNEWKGIVLVFHDITELKKLEQVRKDFVANVSHELKTPVTSIKGFAETLLDGAMFDQQALESFLTIIHKESDRLQSLIQDLLELSKIEQDGFQLMMEKVNMNKIIHDIMDMLNGKASEKDIAVTFIEGKTDEIEGDKLRIQQIFINLISNAISYTPQSGTVAISLDEDSEFVIVSVQDSGIGIEKNEIPRIFERFYRIDKARSRNSGGTGLGLAIVKHLVEALRGEIAVESEVGKGSTFTVKLRKWQGSR